MVDAARGGGTVPSRWLHALAEHPAITVATFGPGDRNGDRPQVTEADGEEDRASDLVWCATGWAVDATTDPVLAPLRATHPTAIHRGIPELTPGLAWPGTSVHLLGAYASLELGPTARNLAGARVGAEAVVGAWWGHQLDRRSE